LSLEEALIGLPYVAYKPFPVDKLKFLTNFTFVDATCPTIAPLSLCPVLLVNLIFEIQFSIVVNPPASPVPKIPPKPFPSLE